MKLPHTALAVMTVALNAVAQQPANPPMKMGLWEARGIVAPNAPSKQERIVRSCITPENWLKMMGPNGPGTCPKINEVWTKDSYSFDVQCSGKSKFASVSVRFIDMEREHIVIDMYSTPTGKPAKVHQEVDDHWVGESCGDLSPKSPVIVR